MQLKTINSTHSYIYMFLSFCDIVVASCYFTINKLINSKNSSPPSMDDVSRHKHSLLIAINNLTYLGNNLTKIQSPAKPSSWWHSAVLLITLLMSHQSKEKRVSGYQWCNISSSLLSSDLLSEEPIWQSRLIQEAVNTVSCKYSQLGLFDNHCTTYKNQWEILFHITNDDLWTKYAWHLSHHLTFC